MKEEVCYSLPQLLLYCARVLACDLVEGRRYLLCLGSSPSSVLVLWFLHKGRSAPLLVLA